GGSMAVKDIEAAAHKVGFNFKRIQKDRKKVRNPRIETGRTGNGVGAKWVWQIEEEQPEDSKDSKDSNVSRALESMESTESTESSKTEAHSMHAPRKPSCQQHGTHYAVSICLTCRGLAKETV